ncbi:TetR/AcrR family transcriptional regulator [Agriterribacter sp.]|uniref:TetR/AcrR family transcriptional regulator n=1 Tax=Agriterribacter sp. TaxID=2821509 RepID=UPI002B93310A|nr:TetR/AcrR family transcriptional regulator [Agriterribacter sp.]HRO46631.1 TetR/AcrR family transcriptional regulator [Agriterribacter sp.]HRQ17291.1 TetR/AcrR family transcriptional regulator [Agriterribacter sp.]
MNHDQKREAIILAAEKRFAHFTVSKTTMAEIARDLGISKPLLYYYFPDKLNLYAAVIDNIISRQQLDADGFTPDEDPLKNIIVYLKKRKDFIFQYYNIIEFVKTAIEKSPDELKPIFNAARISEFKRVKIIFNKGKKSGALKMKDVTATTELFLNCLEGLRHILLQQNGGTIFPGKEAFELIFTKEKELATIFLKGLTA